MAEEEIPEYKQGIKITEGLLKKNATNARHKDTGSEDFLLRITHLSLNSKKISRMVGLEQCVNLRVLYLNDNNLVKIEGLENCQKLQQLDLQDNFISKIECLDGLVSL